MIFRIYPDLIVEESLPNYLSAHQLSEIRLELAKSKPCSHHLNYLLNGGKYDQPID